MGVATKVLVAVVLLRDVAAQTTVVDPCMETECSVDGVCYPHETGPDDCRYCDVIKDRRGLQVRSSFYYVDNFCYPVTWTTQAPYLPEFDWVVIDHGNASSFGFASTITSKAIYLGGFAVGDEMTATNVQTGESITFPQSVGSGAGTSIVELYDIFVVKTRLDGKPEAVWAYEGTAVDVSAEITM